MKTHVLMTLLGSFLLAPVTARAQDTVVYYHTDAIGSVRAITDSTGAEIARYDYLRFGELWPASPPAPADVRQFAGKERDSNTELDYFGARHYRYQSGRFTTVDPVLNIDAALTDPQRWNRYSYAVNRPLTMIDADGREAGYIYLPNGQMVAPIKGMSPTIGKLWAGTLAAGAVVAAGPIAWRAAVGCFFSPSCQLQTINILESAAGASPTPLNPGRLLPVLTETTRAAFLEAALAEGRSGVSAAGRALQSHTSRAGSWLADLAQGGNTAANSKVAKGILEMILERGQTTFGNHPTFGNVIRVRLPDGSGAWWKETGQFIGFLERYTPKQ